MRFCLLLIAAALQAQTARHVDLTWVASPTPSVTYNVYRTDTGCPGITFHKLNATGTAALVYSDTGIPVGTYCYYVTAVGGGQESAASNKVQVEVAPLPPSGLTAISPVAVVLRPGGVQQFVATGGDVARWAISPLLGVISASGFYRAPASFKGNNVRVAVLATDELAHAVMATVTLKR